MPLLMLLAVLTNQLHEATTYSEAKKAYVVIEEIEGILDRKKGELPVKLPKELYRIAWCESGLIHERNDIITTSRTKDYGLMQINRGWIDDAQSMGLDIFEKRDNILFATYLYEKNKLNDWRASRSCWSKLK